MAIHQTSTMAAKQHLTRQQQIKKKQSEIHAEQTSLSRAERARQKRPVGALSIVILVCLALGGVLGLNAYRIQLSYDVLSTQDELTEAQSVYITMQNELDKLASEQGRDAASIGMQKAKLSQMHYIDLATENKIELVGKMSIWDKIAAFFGGLFGKE